MSDRTLFSTNIAGGHLRLELWTACEGPALGATEAMRGREWFYWFPRFVYRNWDLVAGRMVSGQVRWLYWSLALGYVKTNEYGGNVKPIIGGDGVDSPDGAKR